MDETTQNLKKQFDALPTNVQQAISDVNLATKLQDIVKNNKLMIDQAGKIETETMLVLFGLEPLENYVSNLVKNVGLSSVQASVVAHDVNESIFKNIRETLKTISDGMVKIEKETPEQTDNPIKENVMSGIENPSTIKNNESSISLSSLQSNSAKPEVHEEIDRGVEIKINNLPEVAPESMLPITSVLNSKKTEPFHLNIPPVENIVESKLNTTVIVPKETIVVEEKTKLPEKSKPAVDSYREPII